MTQEISIIRATEQHDIEKCLSIRRDIFIVGMNVPEEREVDGLDKTCTHYLVFLNNKPIGTARTRLFENKIKIERVAILQEYQGKGFGKDLIKYIVEDIKKLKASQIITLASQIHAIQFYLNLGFTTYGEEFLDANIVHINMQLVIDQDTTPSPPLQSA